MLLYLAAEGEQNPILPPLSEIILGLISFAVLAYALMRYVFPRMEQTFQARREAIEGGIRRAEEAQAEAQRLLEQYRQQLAEARSEAAQSQQIVRELRTEIGSLAVDLAGRIVGESMADEARQRGTVDRFLGELEGMSARAPVGAPTGGGGGRPAAAGQTGSGPAGSGESASGVGGSAAGGGSGTGGGRGRSRRGGSGGDTDGGSTDRGPGGGGPGEGGSGRRGRRS